MTPPRPIPPTRRLWRELRAARTREQRAELYRRIRRGYRHEGYGLAELMLASGVVE